MIASQLTPRTTAVVALQQIALAAALSLLLIGWLHIPDANAFEVLTSIVVALVLAGLAGAGESFIALRLTDRAVTRRRLLIGTIALCVGALLWCAISSGVDHLGANDGLRAGYLNSRFPASLRNVFSYGHLLLWFEWLWRATRWIAAALLAALAFACVTCDVPLQGLLCIFRTGRYWICLLLLSLVGGVITSKLLTRAPGHGLTAELLSLMLRFAIVVALNATAIALLLQAMAGAILRIQSAGSGEPAINHPRTADKP